MKEIVMQRTKNVLNSAVYIYTADAAQSCASGEERTFTLAAAAGRHSTGDVSFLCACGGSAGVARACRPRWRRQGRGAASTCVAAGGPPPTRGDGPSGFPRRRLGSQQPPAGSPVVYSGERRGWRAAIARLTGAASKRNGACGIGRGPVG